MPSPELKTPVVTITSAVIVQITTVSMNGSSNETIPSVAGSLVLTAECAIGADPIPASFEKTALLKPKIKTPKNPPVTPSGEKAPTKIDLMAKEYTQY